MNFLAHNFLSFGQPGLVVGNYLGDFLRNPEVLLLPINIQDGIRIHRFIDSYTDSHLSVKSATKLLHPTMGKYAPVVIDIYFDYILSKRWTDFSERLLSDYCETSYTILLNHEGIMSPRIANRMRRMVADRWLENYQTYEGLERVFMFLSRRAKFKSNLENAPEILMQFEDKLEDIFLTFFPDLLNHTRSQI